MASAEACWLDVVTSLTLVQWYPTGPGVKRSITGAAIGAEVVGSEVVGSGVVGSAVGGAVADHPQSGSGSIVSVLNMYASRFACRNTPRNVIGPESSSGGLQSWTKGAADSWPAPDTVDAGVSGSQ